MVWQELRKSLAVGFGFGFGSGFGLTVGVFVAAKLGSIIVGGRQFVTNHRTTNYRL
jgi:hypothetical protein